MKLILFDMDGTLIDSAALLLAAQAETCRLHGIPHPGREAGLEVVGLTLDLAIGVLIGTDKPEADMAETYKRVFHELRLSGDPAYAEPLFPGVKEGLERLSQRDDMLLGIATGKSMRGYTYVAERYGWERLFSTVQTADTAPSKPHPGMILQALTETGCDAAETLMVGDSHHDMEMAVAAHVAGIGVSWGFMPVDRLMKAGSAKIITRFDQIDALI
ncbi:MAG: HAD-IA family hydrolase [Bosea sp. (in: a-proteobacteria)]